MNNSKQTRAIILAIIGVIGIIAVFTIKPERERWINNSGITWNTEYNIKYCHHTNLSDSIISVLRKVELSVSPFNKKSRITAINENRSDTLDVYLSRLYDKSVEINRESGGAFDPTVSPLVNLWGFGYKKTDKPSQQAIDSILAFVGINKTDKKGNVLIKSDDRITFNFSAIAKGMGCDEVGKMLERNGVENYVVEIGGEVVARGVSKRGEPWAVAVDMPVANADSVVHTSAMVLHIDSGAVATSGNYRNYKVVDGRKIAHIIDPATGCTAQSDLLSATVVAANCMDADAYATALMVMGLQRAQKFAVERADCLAVVLIYADEADGSLQVWRSPGVARYEK